jgi:hypothetical protein
MMMTHLENFGNQIGCLLWTLDSKFEALRMLHIEADRYFVSKGYSIRYS